MRYDLKTKDIINKDKKVRKIKETPKRATEKKKKKISVSLSSLHIKKKNFLSSKIL